jgi:hypothetical protein
MGVTDLVTPFIIERKYNRMANNTLKTRIVLNNKTSAEWSSETYSATVPLKGEVCIYSDLKKIKIGDGTNTIADLAFANLTPEEVQALISASSHSHSNKSILDGTTASFTTELLTKLNGIANGAEVNQNAFSNIVVGSTTIAADSKTDTLTLVGSNVTITPDETNDKITFTVANGSTSAKGILQLTNSTSSTSTTTAATPSSVKSAYDLANTANTAASNAQSTADSKIGSVSLSSGTKNGTLKLTVDGTSTDNISVKGLGSAAYTESSAYATAAQGTKADNAMPKSGGTFTGAVTLNADPSSALGAATKQYVDTQITTKIAASDAMVFKGTLGTDGTVTAVPTSGVVKGDTYKIITAGTWAGSSCKVGDLIIALNSGSIEANTTNWAYVPSGNENETTIKYSKTTQNLTTSAKTGAITLAEGATKQVDSSISSGSASTNLPTTAAVASYVDEQIGNVNSTISTHTGDTTVHITSDERTKWNAAEANQNAFSNVVVGSTTVAADSKTDTLTLVAGNNVTITPDATNDKITIASTNTTYSAGSGLTFSGTQINHSNSVNAGTAKGDDSKTLSFGDTFKIPSVTYDEQGHITTSSTTTMTMPAAPTSVTGNSGSATKLETSRTIDGMNFNGTANIHHFSECSTAAATAAKVVTLSGFVLASGARITIKFTVTNTAASPTLNVNGTGAKSIMYRGAAISAGYLAANRVYEFIYDGTNWELIGDINVDTNTDTKVTNTLATTTKAYVTGTTSTTTNTGTQVFDTGVYLDTVAGKLVATTFSGDLTGNVTGNVSGSSGSCTGNAATASKAAQLTTARTIALSGACVGTATSFNGTANISIPVTSVDAAKLTIASSDTLILDGTI